MTLHFFIWLAVTGYIPLARPAPFDALGPLLLVTAVHVTLHERLVPRAWIGVAFILLGATIISLSKWSSNTNPCQPIELPAASSIIRAPRDTPRR
jgi:drug/metabolite transporter (DMT)-like permease